MRVNEIIIHFGPCKFLDVCEFDSNGHQLLTPVQAYRFGGKADFVEVLIKK